MKWRPKAERFWEKVDLDSPGGCWLWTACIKGKGYGMFDNARAHTWAWTDANGPVHAGKELHHTCGVRLCVRPSHLVPLARAEHRALHAALQTECKRGHPFTTENTRTDVTGRRHCRTCGAERDRKRGES